MYFSVFSIEKQRNEWQAKEIIFYSVVNLYHLYELQLHTQLLTKIVKAFTRLIAKISPTPNLYLFYACSPSVVNFPSDFLFLFLAEINK